MATYGLGVGKRHLQLVGSDCVKYTLVSESEASLAPGFCVATVAIPHGVRV
jgi:hypothetical protein